MAKTTDEPGSPETGDVVIATSIHDHNEIDLPNDGIVIDVSDQDSTNIKKKLEKKKKRHNRHKYLQEDQSHYAQIGTHVEKCESPSEKPTSPNTPKSPTSIYTVVGGGKNPKLELKAREVSTRQCKFEIGEEWEQFQAIRLSRSISCPPSPVGGRKLSVDNPGYAASEPGAEIDQDLTDASEKIKDPFPFHFLFTSSSTSPVKQHHIAPNPYNKINHRFHSTLQCPCFLFFFFLCCLPAVHLMQKSDSQFKDGNHCRAKKYGTVSTLCFVVGSVLGVLFLAISIYFASDYVRQFV